MNAQEAYSLAWKAGKRVPELEPIVLTDARTSYCYAWHIVKGRWPEAEKVILAKSWNSDPDIIYQYAFYVVRGRWTGTVIEGLPDAERIIKDYPADGFKYLQDIVKDRWEEHEDEIREIWGNAHFHGKGWEKYKDCLSHFPERRWKWLHSKLSANLIDILNYMGMTLNMQRFICQKRPDLIHLIKDLRPSLKKKYFHELELSKVDL